MKSKKLQGIVLKTVLVSTLVCAINMNIIANKGTFSMFTSSIQSSAAMKTADADDFIKKFEIVEEYGQQFIVIEPGELLMDNSIVYFEVTGEAAAYVTQLNPVALSKDKTFTNSKSMQWNSNSRSMSVSNNKQYFISKEGEFYIPINVNINIMQKLSRSTNNDFKGDITLRYLNGFINETKSITLSNDYINTRWACGTDYDFWEKAKNTLSNSNTLEVNKLEDEFANNFQKEYKKLFNETLDNGQIEIIDTIADGYREYVSDLETKNKELLKQIEDIHREKEKSIIQIDALIKENLESNKELKSQIETLKILRLENKQLEVTIEELKKTISNTKATIASTVDKVTEKPIEIVETNDTGIESHEK